MCGITGFARAHHDAEEARRIVKAMADRIVYRGPDGEGYYVDDQVALGHRRLSIIDLEGGKQPMFNEDGSLAVIFNGEIYNFQSLRKELIAAGHTFSTRSDTEVLLHGYEQWGDGLPARLRGMFTFVLWDTRTRTLFGARGHLRHQAVLLLQCGRPVPVRLRDQELSAPTRTSKRNSTSSACPNI